MALTASDCRAYETVSIGSCARVFWFIGNVLLFTSILRRYLGYIFCHHGKVCTLAAKCVRRPAGHWHRQGMSLRPRPGVKSSSPRWGKKNGIYCSRDCIIICTVGCNNSAPAPPLRALRGGRSCRAAVELSMCMYEMWESMRGTTCCQTSRSRG